MRRGEEDGREWKWGGEDANQIGHGLGLRLELCRPQKFNQIKSNEITTHC